MKRGYKFLRVDNIIQWILICTYVAAGLGALVDRDIVIFLLVVQFFLGGWQLLSGIILFALTKNKKRLNYLLTVLAYFVIFALGSMLIAQGIFKETKALMVLSTILVPMVIAFWYFGMTQVDYKEVKQQKNPDAPDKSHLQEEILDDGIWE